ncbi:MAG: hypothetical protein Roseis2KO_41520 [Roseivirga sp.]
MRLFKQQIQTNPSYYEKVYRTLHDQYQQFYLKGRNAIYEAQLLSRLNTGQLSQMLSLHVELSLSADEMAQVTKIINILDRINGNAGMA